MKDTCDDLGSNVASLQLLGSKYPHIVRYLPKTIITIPNIDTIKTPYDGTLDS